MMQNDHPEDFVVGTGETHSVREFCEKAFSYLGLDYREYVIQDPRFYRPAEVDLLIADATRVHQKLGWAPKVDFDGLVRDDGGCRLETPWRRDHLSENLA